MTANKSPCIDVEGKETEDMVGVDVLTAKKSSNNDVGYKDVDDLTAFEALVGEAEEQADA